MGRNGGVAQAPREAPYRTTVYRLCPKDSTTDLPAVRRSSVAGRSQRKVSRAEGGRRDRQPAPLEDVRDTARGSGQDNHRGTLVTEAKAGIAAKDRKERRSQIPRGLRKLHPKQLTQLSASTFSTKDQTEAGSFT